MKRGSPPPVVLLPGSLARFPNPRHFDAEGLIAVGGDLGTMRLVEAYRRGIFPWFEEGYVPLWWSPDPRAVMDPEHLHVSRSLQRVLARGRFELGWNRCFPEVMRACAEGRGDGTWIIPEMLESYGSLHRIGHAHSLEVFVDGELTGGIYGVQVGALFAAESMFHRRTDMSKVALVALVRSLFRAGIELLDVQFRTEHLGSLGAYEVPRTEYLERVKRASERRVNLEGLVPGVA